MIIIKTFVRRYISTYFTHFPSHNWCKLEPNQTIIDHTFANQTTRCSYPFPHKATITTAHCTGKQRKLSPKLLPRPRPPLPFWYSPLKCWPMFIRFSLEQKKKIIFRVRVIQICINPLKHCLVHNWDATERSFRINQISPDIFSNSNLFISPI